MPSKKKRGKARRLAKNKEMCGIDSEMKRLQIGNNSKEGDDDALLEAAINLAAAEKEELEAAAKNDEVENSEKCRHGFVPLPKGHVCEGFIGSFCNVCFEFSKFNLAAGHLLKKIYESMKTKYANVWNDPDKLQMVVSHFSLVGTVSIIAGQDRFARYAATYVSFFEQWTKQIVMYENETQAFWELCDWGKISELYMGDEHTLVSFYRKRIPCKCLDEKLKEVKSIEKIGICQNPTCSLPYGMTARSKMVYCTQCRRANYCSRECQVAAWLSHKKYCANDARRLAALKSKQKK
eukprot:scaffold5069_cov126-Skeletonema_menzelii.AAC.2